MSNEITSNTVKIAICPVVEGIPDKTKARYLRVLSDDLREEKQTDRSQELVDNNTVSDILTVGMDTIGSIEFELSYGGFDDLLETFLRNSWVDNEDGTKTLTNGVEDKTFIIEKQVGDNFYTFYGVKGNDFSISKSLRSRITGSMSFVATHGELSKISIFAGETIAEPDRSNRVMTTYSNLEQHQGLARITSFDYTIANNAAPREDLYSTYDVAQRQFGLTGNGTAFFFDDSVYQTFKTEDVVPFGVRVGQSEDEYYIFNFKSPRIISISGIGGSGGTNTDVFQDFEFEATSDENGIVIEIIKGYIQQTP